MLSLLNMTGPMYHYYPAQLVLASSLYLVIWCIKLIVQDIQLFFSYNLKGVIKVAQELSISSPTSF